MRQKFIGTVKDGKIKLRNADVFNQLVASFKNGTEVEVSIARWRATRSEAENRYYFGVVVRILAEHFGEFPDDMHQNLAWLFLKVQDRPYPKRRSTASLTTEEFEDYLEKVRTWALAEHNVRVPLPGEFEFGDDELKIKT